MSLYLENQSERQRGGTMDIHRVQIELYGHYMTLIDTPGHKDYFKNAINGANQVSLHHICVEIFVISNSIT